MEMEGKFALNSEMGKSAVTSQNELPELAIVRTRSQR